MYVYICICVIYVYIYMGLTLPHTCMRICIHTWIHRYMFPLLRRLSAARARSVRNWATETLSHLGAPCFQNIHLYIRTYINACIDTYIHFLFLAAGCLLRSYSASGTELRRRSLTLARFVSIQPSIRTNVHTYVHTKKITHAYTHAYL